LPDAHPTELTTQHARLVRVRVRARARDRVRLRLRVPGGERWPGSKPCRAIAWLGLGFRVRV